jgi:hypothetical protein
MPPPTLSAATLMTSAAEAEILDFAIDWGGSGGAVETFQLDTLAGTPMRLEPSLQFLSITNDSIRNTGIFFGDSSADGRFGTGHTVGNEVSRNALRLP